MKFIKQYKLLDILNLASNSGEFRKENILWQQLNLHKNDSFEKYVLYCQDLFRFKN